MKRYLLVAIIIAIIAGTMFGLFVGRNEAITPEEQVAFVVDQYFRAWQELQPQLMYGYISINDRTDVPLQQYVDQFNEFPVRPIRYEIVSVSDSFCLGYRSICQGKIIDRLA